jgi:hypothetical protein
MTKHIFPTLIIATLLFLQTINAKIWTVSNNSADQANFAALQLAYDGANSGDTLFVFGSGIDYGNITLNKKTGFNWTGILFIGKWYSSKNKQCKIESN